MTAAGVVSLLHVAAVLQRGGEGGAAVGEGPGLVLLVVLVAVGANSAPGDDAAALSGRQYEGLHASTSIPEPPRAPTTCTRGHQPVHPTSLIASIAAASLVPA